MDFYIFRFDPLYGFRIAHSRAHIPPHSTFQSSFMKYQFNLATKLFLQKQAGFKTLCLVEKGGGRQLITFFS